MVQRLPKLLNCTSYQMFLRLLQNTVFYVQKISINYCNCKVYIKKKHCTIK